MSTLYDLSPTISADLPAWPGDVPFTQQWTLRLDHGDSCNLSSFATSAHLGSHVDAPLHFLEDGAGVSELPLAPFLGPAQVVHLRGSGPITPEELDGLNLHEAVRLLFHTGSQEDPRTFPRGFRAFTPEAARTLAALDLLLVGTDAPSVDAFENKDLVAHQIFGGHEIAILENLCLERVPEGVYELIALPLKLQGLDGSPVRVILRTIE